MTDLGVYATGVRVNTRYRAPDHVSESRAMRYWEDDAMDWGSYGFEPSTERKGKGTYKGEGKGGYKGGASWEGEWKGKGEKGYAPRDKGKGSEKGKGKSKDMGWRWDRGQNWL